MSMDGLKDVIAKSSPLIASVLGSINPLAGVLFSAVAHLFGLPTTATADDVANAVNADPDHDIKLRTLEVQHQDDLFNAKVQLRLGAYNRESEVVKATGKRDFVLDILALGTVGGYFLISTLVFFVHIDTSMNGIVNFMCGELSTAAMMVLAYFFGATFSRPAQPSTLNKEVVLPPPAQTK